MDLFSRNMLAVEYRVLQSLIRGYRRALPEEWDANLKRQRQLSVLIALSEKNNPQAKEFIAMASFNINAKVKYSQQQGLDYTQAWQKARQLCDDFASVSILYLPALRFVRHKLLAPCAAVYGQGDGPYWDTQRVPAEILSVAAFTLLTALGNIKKNHQLRSVRSAQLFEQGIRFNSKPWRQYRPGVAVFCRDALEIPKPVFYLVITLQNGDIKFYDKRSFLRRKQGLHWHVNPGATLSWMHFSEALLAAKRLLDQQMAYQQNQQDIRVKDFPASIAGIRKVRIHHAVSGLAVGLPVWMETFHWLKGDRWLFEKPISQKRAEAMVFAIAKKKITLY